MIPTMKLAPFFQRLIVSWSLSGSHAATIGMRASVMMDGYENIYERVFLGVSRSREKHFGSAVFLPMLSGIRGYIILPRVVFELFSVFESAAVKGPETGMSREDSYEKEKPI